jgi:hypothetical protein
VDEFLVDGQLHPPLLTDDLRWQRVIFTSVYALTIQQMNGQFSPYAVKIDTQKNTLTVKRIPTAGASSPWWSELYPPPIGSGLALRWRDSTELNYNRPQPDGMILEGLVDGRRLRVTLKKEERQFTLKTLGFRWINDEHDFYNEFFLK